MTIVQVVPRLPPPAEGVGSYAEALAAALSRRCGIESVFVVGDPAWPKDQAETPADARRVDRRRAGALRRAIEAAAGAAANKTVLAHYVGYGYARRGCPRWLVDGLETWARAETGRRLFTVFHELWAEGPAWRSSFWLEPLQRRLATRLARLSAAVVTSLESSATTLSSIARGRTVEVLPVFSTVGEPAAAPRPEERRPHLAVFGGRGLRERAYGRFREQLEAACRGLGVEEVIDIGPEVATGIGAVAGRPLRRLGFLPVAEVSRVLLRCRFGFVAYPVPLLPKSTVYAAYSSHGLLPVCAWQRVAVERARTGVPFVPAEEAESGIDPGRLTAVVRAAQDWYDDHRLDRQAAVFGRLFAP